MDILGFGLTNSNKFSFRPFLPVKVDLTFGKILNIMKELYTVNI